MQLPQLQKVFLNGKQQSQTESIEYKKGRERTIHVVEWRDIPSHPKSASRHCRQGELLEEMQPEDPSL